MCLIKLVLFTTQLVLVYNKRLKRLQLGSMSIEKDQKIMQQAVTDTGGLKSLKGFDDPLPLLNHPHPHYQRLAAIFRKGPLKPWVQ